jgi:hypothetical protein
MRIAIYARVSTKDQSCALQLRDLKTYCTARKLTVFREYIDVGESGAKDSRPKLNELMASGRVRHPSAASNVTLRSHEIVTLFDSRAGLATTFVIELLSTSSPAGGNHNFADKTKSFAGIAFCVCSAVLLSFLLNDDPEIRLVAPLINLFVVIATSFLWGRMAAIVGGSAASLTFAALLFPPLGSIRVSDPSERTTLILFQLFAIGLSFLSPPSLPMDRFTPNTRSSPRNRPPSDSNCHSRKRSSDSRS